MITESEVTRSRISSRQVVLNGSLFTLPGWLAPVTAVLPARLGFAAAANYGLLDGQRRRAGLASDALWEHGADRFWQLLAGEAGITAVALALAATVLWARWRRRVE
ncbi:hypothetical protein [Dactylosporangium sp. CA-233914]|uniref:hypothetical protein n=1 Tax=Dactylosporangium sp. CA-233914 TaxID=3239934 RepID=UPI003D92E301